VFLDPNAGLSPAVNRYLTYRYELPKELTVTMTSRTDRAEKIREAADSLATLIGSAVLAEKTLGSDHPDVLAAWEEVEKAGATIHRQGRLLAGKKRGG
jgi:hypothetical protein